MQQHHSIQIHSRRKSNFIYTFRIPSERTHKIEKRSFFLLFILNFPFDNNDRKKKWKKTIDLNGSKQKDVEEYKKIAQKKEKW